MKLTHYQHAAARNAEGIKTPRLALNLLVGLGDLAETVTAADDAATQPLREGAAVDLREQHRESAERFIGVILFNATALADRFGVALEPLLSRQVEKMQGITDSGRLRMKGDR